MPAISLWRFREANRRGLQGSGDRGGAGRNRSRDGRGSFGHLDRSQKFLHVREIFVEGLGDRLPGNLEYGFAGYDGPAFRVLYATVGIAIRQSHGQSEETGNASDTLGNWQWSPGQRNDLRDALAFAQLTFGIGKAVRRVAVFAGWSPIANEFECIRNGDTSSSSSSLTCRVAATVRFGGATTNFRRNSSGQLQPGNDDE
jgi:hypothetical protein